MGWTGDEPGAAVPGFQKGIRDEVDMVGVGELDAGDITRRRPIPIMNRH